MGEFVDADHPGAGADSGSHAASAVAVATQAMRRLCATERFAALRRRAELDSDNSHGMYLDAFITCAAGSACDANAAAFTDYMSMPATRMMIACSWDRTALVQPPRHALPAITAFHDQPLVQRDPLYTQHQRVIAAANAFPNTINPALETQMYQAICVGLKTRNPQYRC